MRDTESVSKDDKSDEPFVIGGFASRAVGTASACAATVGCSNITATGISTPNSTRKRDTTWVASKECPPSPKKSSRRPIVEMRNRADQIFAIFSSTGDAAGSFGAWQIVSSG